MKKSIVKISVFCFLLLSNTYLFAQNNLLNKTDTLHFICAKCVYDTLYLTRDKIKMNTYRQVEHYLFSDTSKLSTTVIDTFIIGKSAWHKVYNNATIPFLSVKDFAAKKKGYEYLDREKRELFYKEYEPVKKYSIQGKLFYLYRVRPMSGKGMVESLGDDIYYVVFNFTIGEVYRSSYQAKKTLMGYEKYVKYFKW